MDRRRPKSVWPNKCCCTGVKVSSIVEVLNVSPVSTHVASGQVSDHSPQTFKASLLAISKALSCTHAANGEGAGRRQKSVAEAANLPSTMPNVRAVPSSAPPPQTVQQQVPVAQQKPLINPALLSPQFPLVEPTLSAPASTVAAVRPIPDVPLVRHSALASNLLPPEAAEPDSVTASHPQKESDPPQVASVLPLVAHFLLNAMTVSSAVVNLVPSPLLSTVSNHPTNVLSKADASAVAGAGASALPDVVQKLVPNPIPDSVPSAAQNAVPSPVTSVASNALPQTVMSTVSVADPGAALSPDSSPFPSLHPTAIPSTVQGPVPSAVQSAVRSAVPNLVPGAVEHWASPVVPNAIPNAYLNAFRMSALHGVFNQSPKGDTAPKPSPAPMSEANPPAAPSPDGLATSPNIPDPTPDQLLVLLQPGGELLVTAPAGAPGPSPVAVTKPAVTTTVANRVDGAVAATDSSGLKPHAQSVSDTGSQETAPSGDQSQMAAPQQVQGLAQAQIGSVGHTIAAVDHTPNAAITPPLQTVSTLVGGHAAKTSDTAVPATTVLPQPASVINTARLIQSIGQTEMRVGLRSNDFGNISISTSATRDLISAQISLDHGELARTLAVHLTEMQTRLGGSQAMDVRIDMNGQQGTGTAASMSNGSAADGSRGERQQKGSAASSQSSDSFAGRGNSIAAAALAGEGRLSAGLDIRV